MDSAEKIDISVEQHPLEPFLPLRARLLLLGSFPPPRNRWCMDFFYPNRTNMMWEVMGKVFYDDSVRLLDIEHKTFRLDDIKTMLRENGIAIFDSASSVRRMRSNASDKFLEVILKTDLPSLLVQLPYCHDMVCTGQKSAELICEDYGAALPKMGESTEISIGDRKIRLHRMPSTSRAFPMKLEDRVAYYRQLMFDVGILLP